MQNVKQSNKSKMRAPIIFRAIEEEFLADTETPVSLYLKLQGKYSCLLESVEGEARIARYSYIGVEPFATLDVRIDEHKTDVNFTILDKKFHSLKSYIESASSAKEAIERSLTAFSNKKEKYSAVNASAIGYIGYDAVRLLEKIPFPKQPDPANLPDVFLMFFDTLVIMDNVKRKLFIVANYLAKSDKANAEKKIKRIKKKILTPLSPKKIPPGSEQKAIVKSNITKEAYLQKTLKAKEYILAGDIFQVQLSQRLRRKITGSAFDVYRSLRAINPSPYLYFFDFGDAQIVGSSPELLVGVTKQNERFLVETRPIAGTRKRGATPEQDLEQMNELLADEKERAEHLMLIDLSRNDIGKIAEIGSVKTTEIMTIEKYSHVMHLVSHVQGILKSGLSPMDAFWSCFPAGTLAGAPKIRAMEIISELETEKRGLYGGAVGIFDFNGNIKTAIAIRTMVVKHKTIYFQAAGGIVADSAPESEYEETMNKMAAGLRAVEELVKSK